MANLPRFGGQCSIKGICLIPVCSWLVDLCLASAPYRLCPVWYRLCVWRRPSWRQLCIAFARLVSALHLGSACALGSALYRLCLVGIGFASGVSLSGVLAVRGGSTMPMVSVLATWLVSGGRLSGSRRKCCGIGRRSWLVGEAVSSADEEEGESVIARSCFSMYPAWYRGC